METELSEFSQTSLALEQPHSNTCPTPNLGEYKAYHIDEDLTSGALGVRENELFFNCTLKDLRNTTLKNCNMQHSRVLTDDPKDALGLTVTLDCKTFQDVELSPMVFDLLLVLLLKTKGNLERRKKLLDLVGKDRVKEILLKLGKLE